MFNKHFQFIFFASVFAFSGIDHVFGAEDDSWAKHEIRASSTNGVLSFDDDATRFSANGDYAYLIAPHLQLIGRLNFSYLDPDRGDSVSAWGLTGGAQYNFPADAAIFRQYYGGAFLGFQHAEVRDEEDTDFVLGFLFGKRFPLTKQFTYSPKVELAFVGGDVSFSIFFLSFSYFL